MKNVLDIFPPTWEAMTDEEKKEVVANYKARAEFAARLLIAKQTGDMLQIAKLWASLPPKLHPAIPASRDPLK